MTIPDWRGMPWLRKLIFVGGNLAAAAVIVSGLAMPVRDFFAERDTHIAEQRALLARLQSVAAQERDIQTAAREIAEEAKRGEFVLGLNEGVINADLQTQLKLKAEQAGARLRSIQILPARTQDGVRLVGSRLDIQGSLQAIYRTVYAIESGRPYHFIADAVIKPSPPVIVQGAPGEPMIEARLDIFVATQTDGNTQ